VILLAGLLEVVLKAFVLLGLALAVGGLVFRAAVLLPLGPSLPAGALRLSLRLVAAGGAIVFLAQLSTLLLAPWALADELGRWPLAAVLATGFARAGLVRAALGGAIAAAALRRAAAGREEWPLRALAILLAASGAPLVHGAGRLEHVPELVAATLVHQLAAVTWAGGLVHLLAQRLAGRRDEIRARTWPDLLARFSPVAIASVGLLLASAALLALRYVGSVGALVGTAYGVMVLAKAALLATALALARAGFAAARRRRAGRADAAPERETTPRLEAEAATVLVALLAAAALTSQPPAVDVGDRPTPREVAGVFAPKRPQLTPPPHGAMVAQAAPSLDPFATPGVLDRLQSAFNHNVSGILVALAAAAAFLGRLARARAARHWPLLLLPLAAFVLLLGEPNGWPFGPEGFFETLLAPAVLVHRVAPLLVVALALFEWRVQAGGLAATRWRFAFPLLCVAGGALLLTHSHTAFAARWAFLIEVSHSAIGLLAVLMGVSRWLEVRRGVERRVAVWPALMALIGLVLLFYREP
jgi:putative copper resistance protein D